MRGRAWLVLLSVLALVPIVFDVLAIDAGGNQTLTERSFVAR